MSVIYITDHGSLVSFQGNRIIVTDKDDEQQSFPVETVEGITLLSMSQLTTQCIEQCLIKGITVSFLSKGGTYFGRLISTGHVDSALQRKQSLLYNTDFSIELGRIILTAKLKNQLTVLRRYAKSRGVDIDNEINMIKSCERSINSSVSIPQIMGYEGQAAKTYFSGLNKCVDDEFHFDCRSRRPPKDEFNSMLSFGYSILINEIYSEIAAKGVESLFWICSPRQRKTPYSCQ